MKTELYDLIPDLTKEQKNIVDKNIKVIYDVVNTEYEKQPKDIKDELSSHGYIVICNHITKYRETDNIYSFMKNILKYSLKNYYNRSILGYKPKYLDRYMNEKDRENKSVYDEIYEERLDAWKKDVEVWEEYQREWKSTYSTPFEIEKPKKPSKTYYAIQQRQISSEIKEDTASVEYDDVKENTRYIIDSAIDTLSPIKQKFVVEVYYNNKKPELVVSEINNEILTMMTDVKFKVEMCDYLNVKRDEILNVNDTDNPMLKYVYKKIVESKDDIQSIYKRIKAQSHNHYKISILEELKSKLKDRIR